MEDDNGLRRARAERDDTEDERDDAEQAARDFAKALQQVTEEGADVWRIATEALQGHPEYDIQ